MGGILDKIGIGGIVGGVTGVAQLGMGIADRIKGKKKLKEAESFWEDNKYEIPESAKASLANAERQASGVRLPAEDLRRAQMGQATAQGVGTAQGAATSSGDVLGVLSSLYGQQMVGEQNLGIEGAQRFDQNQTQLRGELGRMAELETEKWQYNSLYPYQQMLGQAEAYQSRGNEGIGMGANALTQTAGDYTQMQAANDQNREFMRQMGLLND